MTPRRRSYPMIRIWWLRLEFDDLTSWHNQWANYLPINELFDCRFVTIASKDADSVSSNPANLSGAMGRKSYLPTIYGILSSSSGDFLE